MPVNPLFPPCCAPPSQSFLTFFSFHPQTHDSCPEQLQLLLLLQRSIWFCSSLQTCTMGKLSEQCHDSHYSHNIKSVRNIFSTFVTKRGWTDSVNMSLVKVCIKVLNICIFTHHRQWTEHHELQLCFGKPFILTPSPPSLITSLHCLHYHLKYVLWK